MNTKNQELDKKDNPSHEEHGHVHGPHCNHHHGPPTTPMRRVIPKVGRNDDCPCGSQKKYKKCCGK